MPKCDFNEASYFQGTFFKEHLWTAASGIGLSLLTKKQVKPKNSSVTNQYYLQPFSIL